MGEDKKSFLKSSKITISNLIEKLKHILIRFKKPIISTISTIILGIIASYLFVLLNREDPYSLEKISNSFISANSNILDVYYFNKDLEYKINIKNTSQYLWENITVTSSMAFFAYDKPYLSLNKNSDLSFLNHKRKTYLRPNESFNIDISTDLNNIFDKPYNIQSSFIVKNPYEFLTSNTWVLKNKKQIYMGTGSTHKKNTKNKDIVEYLLSKTSNYDLCFSNNREIVKAGFIVLVRLKFKILNDKSFKVEKIIPFINFWCTRGMKIEAASDIYFINEPIRLSEEKINNEYTVNHTTAVYEMQDDAIISDYIVQKGSTMRHPTFNQQLNDGDNHITFHTFVILDNDNSKRFFKFDLKRSGKIGETVHFQVPFY